MLSDSCVRVLLSAGCVCSRHPAERDDGRLDGRGMNVCIIKLSLSLSLSLSLFFPLPPLLFFLAKISSSLSSKLQSTWLTTVNSDHLLPTTAFRARTVKFLQKTAPCIATTCLQEPLLFAPRGGLWTSFTLHVSFFSSS